MLSNILIISFSTSVILTVLLMMTPVLNKRYAAKWRYFLWLVFAIRLIIPVRFVFSVPEKYVPNHTVVVTSKNKIDTKTSTKANAKMPDTENKKSIDLSGNIKKANIDFSKVITIIWALGAAASFLYYIIQYLVFKKRIKPYLKKTNKFIYESSMVISPMLIGFFKPAIILQVADYSKKEKAVIIKHEITHYRRRDIWYKLILILANSIHWFNPIIYLFVKRAQCDLEYSCDDIVTKNRSLDYKKHYSQTILKHMIKNSASII